MKFYRLAQSEADHSKLYRLREILDTMDVPQGRKADPRWLLRNLFVRNGEHDDFEEAIRLLKELAPMLANPMSQEQVNRWHKIWDKQESKNT